MGGTCRSADLGHAGGEGTRESYPRRRVGTSRKSTSIPGRVKGLGLPRQSRTMAPMFYISDPSASLGCVVAVDVNALKQVQFRPQRRLRCAGGCCLQTHRHGEQDARALPSTRAGAKSFPEGGTEHGGPMARPRVQRGMQRASREVSLPTGHVDLSELLPDLIIFLLNPNNRGLLVGLKPTSCAGRCHHYYRATQT